jgi:ribosome-associated toxin RatA of RatAB toxin-antitoxin module
MGDEASKNARAVYPLVPPFNHGAMPVGRVMETLDEGIVRAPVEDVFAVVRDVENWPTLLSHYRYVRFRSRSGDGGGIVEMSANRPFGVANWPTWWLSEMSVDNAKPAVRFRHIGGVTKEMEVEWSLTRVDGGTHVRLVHAWDGPRWPVIGAFAATAVIGPVFIHGIASRTLAGLSRHVERLSRPQATRQRPPATGHRPESSPNDSQ